MRLLNRYFFKNQIIIKDRDSGKVIDRYAVSSPMDAPRQCTDTEQPSYISSWWHLLVDKVNINFLRRLLKLRTPFAKLWDNQQRTRVGDILKRPYVATSRALELHVHDDHFILYHVMRTGKVQIPLFDLKQCQDAVVKSNLPAIDVLERVRSQPYELSTTTSVQE